MAMGCMRGRAITRRAVSLPIVLALALSLVPLEADPAEAARFKFRGRSSWGARSASSSADQADEHRKGRPRSPGAAAAAAGRARAALEAEKAKGAPVDSNPQRLIPGKTTGYQNGVTCIAGC